MLNIAIVEDSLSDVELLQGFISRFESENNISFETEVFKNGLDFVSDYKPKFDIIYLDIEMPYLNGMQTAKKIREVDKSVVIIFYTNLVRFAIAGYSVNAMDFLVKPAQYIEFEKKMKRAVRYASQRSDKYLTVGMTGGIAKLSVADVLYVEKDTNKLVYHTADAEYSERANLYAKEPALEKLGFAKCRSGCMVNLQHVKKCTLNCVTVGEVEIPVSRSEQKSFMNKVLLYLNGTLR